MFALLLPTPIVPRTTIFFTLYSLITARVLRTESAIKVGGEVVLAQGLSLVRPVFNVDMTALMGSDLGALAKALEMSV